MSRPVLRQFFLAIALIVLYQLIASYHAFAAHPQFAERAGGLGTALLLDIPHAVLFALPIAAGVALALLPIGAGAFRQGIVMAGGVSALLVVNDLAGRGLWHAIEVRKYGQALPPERFNDSTSALGGAIAHLMGRVRAEDIQQWPPAPSQSGGFQPITDPQVIIRMSAVMKYTEARRLFVPLIVCGLVLGLGTWLHRAATFRSPRDERVLRLALGWLLAVVTVVGLHGSGGGALYELSSPRASIAWLFAPYLLAMVLAALGWRATRQLDSLAAG
ncbi:MAG: hypothetical protein ABIQ41_03355 [Gemmatimonadales bacterium]